MKQSLIFINHINFLFKLSNQRETLSKSNTKLQEEEFDTLAVAKETLEFMRTNGLTVTEFSEKVRRRMYFRKIWVRYKDREL